MSAGPVGRRLAGGPHEHQKGATSVGLYRVLATEGGGGSVRLEKVLSRGGTSGVAIWGGDLSAVGCNGEET